MTQNRFKPTFGLSIRRMTLAMYTLLLTYTNPLPSQTLRGSFTEHFDSTATGSLPVGWKANGFSVSGTSPHSAPNCVSATGNMTEKWFMTPDLDLIGRFPLQLTFFERRSSTAGRYRVEVSASLDGITFPITLARFDSIGTTTAYVQRVISLEGHGLENQPSIRMRWRIRADSTNSTGVLRLDDIALTCAASADIAVCTLGVSPPVPRRTEPVCVNALIRNRGRLPVQDFSVTILEDRNADAVLSDDETMTALSGCALAVGDSLRVAIPLPPFPPGPHRLYARTRWPVDEELSNDTLSVMINISCAQGDIAVTEIMYAPSDDEPEWIELCNTTDDTIDVRGWKISDSNTAIRAGISSDSPVPPGSFLICARDATFAAVHPDPSILVRSVSFSALNNTTPDAVVLFDPSGVAVDSVRYEPGWGGQSGRSLERIDELSARCDAGNWAGCVDPTGSTPGQVNSIARLPYDLQLSRAGWEREPSGAVRVWGVISNAGRRTATGFSVTLSMVNADDTAGTPARVLTKALSESLLPLDSVVVSFGLDSTKSGQSSCTLAIAFTPDERRWNDTLRMDLFESYAVGDMIVNEIMFDPFAGQPEWIEVLNRTPRPISLDDWTISDAPTPSGAVNQARIHSNLVLAAGSLWVFAADSAIFDAFPGLRAEPSRCTILNLSSGLGLNNDGEAVVLRDPSGRTIDSVRYEARWHHPSLPDPRGHSLERIVPELLSNDPRNWSSCTTPRGGSPGERNSITAQPSPSAGALSISPNPFSPDGDGFEDFCTLRYHLPFASCVMNVRVFDLRGRLIRWLANTEFTGADGVVVWDGLSDARQRVRIGGYIVLLQATRHPDGAEFSARALIAVATRF